jgi:hypothetical protein
VNILKKKNGIKICVKKNKLIKSEKLLNKNVKNVKMSQNLSENDKNRSNRFVNATRA